MKKFVVYVVLFLSSLLVSAQNQCTNSGNFHIHSGTNITFFGNFQNEGTFVDEGTLVTFMGANAQITGSSPITFRNLTANNATGTTLQQDVTITNSLVLTAGQLNLNSHTLTINNNAPTAISRTSGYILSDQTDNSSKIVWNIGTNSNAHIFPFGSSAGTYIPFTLTVTAGDIGNVTVSTYPTASNNTPLPTVPDAITNVDSDGIDNSANVVDRFWQISKDGPSGTSTIIFEATPAEVGTISTLTAQRWNTSTNSWDEPLPGQTATATSVTVPGVTSFSPWTLSGNNTILPVELVRFTARPSGTNAELNWETRTEINNDYFTVQNSIDGKIFVDIGKVKGAGTTQLPKEYNYLDINVPAERTYYRLKQTDFDGRTKFSNIERVDLENHSSSAFSVYPNPSTGKFTLNSSGDYKIESILVLNMHGKLIGSMSTVTSQVSYYTGNFDLENNVSGMYVIKVVHNQGTNFIKLVKE